MGVNVKRVEPKVTPPIEMIDLHGTAFPERHIVVGKVPGCTSGESDLVIAQVKDDPTTLSGWVPFSYLRVSAVSLREFGEACIELAKQKGA